MAESNNINQAEVQSPCIGVCAMNEATGFCHGCYRTMDEIQGWWDFDNQQKQVIVERAAEREASAFES